MTGRTNWVMVAGVVWAGWVSAVIAADGKRLDPDNLLQFHGAGGAVQAVKTAADWAKRRAEIVEGMQSVMGRFPGSDRRGPVGMKVIEDVDAGSYRRQLIGYTVDKDMLTPAYLCIPKDVLAGKRKAAAVLCLHPTDNRVGHKVVGWGAARGGPTARNWPSEDMSRSRRPTPTWPTTGPTSAARTMSAVR